MHETISKRPDAHETRIAALEHQSTEAKKPWFQVKGVLGPLASGTATIALVVGYINKGLDWARVILGTPGGAVLIDRGFDWLQGGGSVGRGPG